MTVYDEEKEKVQQFGKPNDLQDNPDATSERPGAEDEALGRLHKGKSKSPKTIVDDKEAGLYKSGSSSKKKTKKKLFIAAGGFGFVLFIIILILFFVSFLKIPHFAERISAYHFARTARIFRKSVSNINAQKIYVDSSNPTRLQNINNRYQGIRSATWGKLDVYRPNMVMRQMQATGVIEFDYQRRPLGGQRLVGLRVNGVNIDPPDTSRLHPIQSRGERIRFAAQTNHALGEALKDSKTIVRGKVAKNIRAQLGIKLSFWERYGFKYRNLTAEEAKKQILRDKHAKRGAAIQRHIEARRGAVTRGVDSSADATRAALSDAVDSDSGAARITESRGQQLPTDVTSELEGAERAMGLTGRNAAISTVSTAYAIAAPLCIIYDGSIERSEESTDAQSDQLQSAYYEVASAGDQIKAGGVEGQAISALDQSIQTSGNTAVEMRARGDTVNKDVLPVSPQASAFGDYTILDHILPSGFITSVVKTGADEACPILSDVRMAAVMGVLETAATAASGGTAGGFRVVAREFGVQFVRNLGRAFATKRGLTRLGLEAGGTYGLTLLARGVVAREALMDHSGIAMDDDYINEADMGGDIHANEINRQQLYGRPLNIQEEVADARLNKQFLEEKLQSKPFTERYFAIMNPDSFISKFAFTIEPFTRNIGFTTQLRFIGSSFSPLISKTTGAETLNVNQFGIVQWGWTEQELNLIEEDDSYTPLENARIWLEETTQTRRDEIEEKYGKCFTESMGKILSEKWIQRNEDGSVITDRGDCSPQNLGPNNENGLVFRYRLFMKNEEALDHLLNIQNPSPGSSEPGSRQKTSSNGQCSGETALPFSQTLTPSWFNANDHGTSVSLPRRTNGHNTVVFNQNHNAFGADSVLNSSLSVGEATDMGLPAGTDIYAPFSGEILYAGSIHSGSDSMIIMESNNGDCVAALAHINPPELQAGNSVEAGETIGELSNISLPHLHFELWVDGEPVNIGENPDACGYGEDCPAIFAPLAEEIWNKQKEALGFE